MRWSTKPPISTVILLLWITMLFTEAVPSKNIESIILLAKAEQGQERESFRNTSTNEYLSQTPEFPTDYIKKADSEDDRIDFDSGATSIKNTKGWRKEIEIIRKEAESGKMTGESARSAGLMVCKVANIAADLFPVPIVGPAVKMVASIFGSILEETRPSPEEIMNKKLDHMGKAMETINAKVDEVTNTVTRVEGRMVLVEEKVDSANKKLDNLTNTVEKVDKKIDTVVRKLDKTDRKVDEVNGKLDDAGETLEEIKIKQDLHSKMIKSVTKELHTGFTMLSERFDSRLRELQMDIHENMFIQVVKIPAKDLNRGVTALMTNPTASSLSYMRHMCDQETPSRVFSAMSEYAMAPNGYFEKNMQAGKYTLATFYSLKIKIRDVLTAVIFAEVLCNSLNVMNDKKWITAEPTSVILKELVNEYNILMGEINKKRRIIISNHWDAIRKLIGRKIGELTEQVYRDEYIQEIENEINENYSFKTKFFLTAGTINRVFVDDGSGMPVEHNKKGEIKRFNFEGRIGGGQNNDYIVYRMFTNETRRVADQMEKKYRTKLNEDKSDWLKLLMVSSRGTPEVPILYMLSENDVKNQFYMNRSPNHTMKWEPVARNNKQTLLQLKVL